MKRSAEDGETREDGSAKRAALDVRRCSTRNARAGTEANLLTTVVRVCSKGDWRNLMEANGYSFGSYSPPRSPENPEIVSVFVFRAFESAAPIDSSGDACPVTNFDGSLGKSVSRRLDISIHSRLKGL